MAKKKPPEEHENLERWLVSYGDFITLLFATFVVLYALAQVDVSDFAKLEESLKNAFDSANIFDAQEMILDGSQNIFDQQQANSFIPSLMLEYISPKYEEESFKDIEESVKNLKDSGELEGISAQLTDKGLLLTFEDTYLFAPASAYLDSKAKKLLDKVGVLICKKFVLHAMRVEGHTDNNPINSTKYPSNWELSSARACAVVRYLISRFGFNPSLFSAIGYADTRPLEKSFSPKDPKNRRVEILILKNSYNNSYENRGRSALSLSKAEQEKIQKQRENVIKQVERDSISPAARKLLEENRLKMIEKQKSEKLSKKNMDLYIKLDKNTSDSNIEELTEQEKHIIQLNSHIPEDEDLNL
jgi:chemotaxis protein MotB